MAYLTYTEERDELAREVRAIQDAAARAQLTTPPIRPYLYSALAKRAAHEAHERFDALQETP
jgi:hypothetical protein